MQVKSANPRTDEHLLLLTVQSEKKEAILPITHFFLSYFHLENYFSVPLSASTYFSSKRSRDHVFCFLGNRILVMSFFSFSLLFIENFNLTYYRKVSDTYAIIPNQLYVP